MAVPADVEAHVGRWLAKLQPLLSAPVTGCYLVGSAALDDFSPQVSNIDLVLCGNEGWKATDWAAVEDRAGNLERKGRAAHIDLVTYDDLEKPGPRPDPYTRDLLYDAPALRGRRRPPAAIHDGDLETWARRQLRERVEPWTRRTNFPARGWTKAGLTPMLLDACRLYAAAQGHTLSKSEAAELVLSEGTRKARRAKVLGEAISYRHGASTSNYWGPVERKRDALDLIDQLLSSPALTA